MSRKKKISMIQVKHCDELIESSQCFFRTLKNLVFVSIFYHCLNTVYNKISTIGSFIIVLVTIYNIGILYKNV